MAFGSILISVAIVQAAWLTVPVTSHEITLDEDGKIFVDGVFVDPSLLSPDLQAALGYTDPGHADPAFRGAMSLSEDGQQLEEDGPRRDLLRETASTTKTETSTKTETETSTTKTSTTKAETSTTKTSTTKTETTSTETTSTETTTTKTDTSTTATSTTKTSTTETSTTKTETSTTKTDTTTTETSTSTTDTSTTKTLTETTTTTATTTSVTTTTITRTTTNLGCDSLCEIEAFNATCRSRIAWTEMHTTKDESAPCPAAHVMVMSMCPTCGGCKFEDVKCTIQRGVSKTSGTEFMYKFDGDEARLSRWAEYARGFAVGGGVVFVMVLLLLLVRNAGSGDRRESALLTLRDQDTDRSLQASGVSQNDRERLLNADGV